MTIRADALRWLVGQNVRGGHVVASKRYEPDESWTRDKAWWLQVPASAIRAGKIVHLLCEKEPGSRTFYHLEVPASYFQHNLDGFATIGDDKINLFLAATEKDWLRDLRGPGRHSFAKFLRYEAAAPRGTEADRHSDQFDGRLRER